MATIKDIVESKPRPAEIGAPTPEFTDSFRAWQKTQPAFIELLRRIQNGEDRRSLYALAGQVGVSEHRLGALYSASSILRNPARRAAAREFPQLEKEMRESAAKLAAAQTRHGAAAGDTEREKVAKEVREISTEHLAILGRWGQARSAARALAAARDLGFAV
jgi:methylphosphotriester-DNA--protein-cysteine methyltransferase